MNLRAILSLVASLGIVANSSVVLASAPHARVVAQVKTKAHHQWSVGGDKIVAEAFHTIIEAGTSPVAAQTLESLGIQTSTQTVLQPRGDGGFRKLPLCNVDLGTGFAVLCVTLVDQNGNAVSVSGGSSGGSSSGGGVITNSASSPIPIYAPSPIAVIVAAGSSPLPVQTPTLAVASQTAIPVASQTAIPIATIGPLAVQTPTLAVATPTLAVASQTALPVAPQTPLPVQTPTLAVATPTLPVASQTAIPVASQTALPVASTSVPVSYPTGGVPLATPVGGFPTPINYTTASPLPVYQVNASAGGSSSPPPYSSVAFATATPAANTSYAQSCTVATPTAAPTGAVIPETCSPTNGGLNIGPLTANVSSPYSMNTTGQAPLAASGAGILGLYTTTLPTLTNNTVSPVQINQDGAQLFAMDPTTPGTTNLVFSKICDTATTTSCATVAQLSATISNSAYAQIVQNYQGAFSGTTSNPKRVGSDAELNGPMWVTQGGSVTYAATTSGLIYTGASRIVSCFQTAVATTAGVATVYDNTAASGTVLLNMPVGTSLTYTTYTTNMPAATGLYWSNTAIGGAVTCSYFN